MRLTDYAVGVNTLRYWFESSWDHNGEPVSTGDT